MDKYLSRWTSQELKQFSREHGPLLVVRDPRTGRVNKRSYYNAVKRYIKRNRPTPLYKLKLAQLTERIEAENIPLPEHGGGRIGRIIQFKKDYVAAIKKFYEPEEELNFDEPLIDGGRYLHQWTMTVPLGHKEKDPIVFLEVVRPNINAKLTSDLQEFQRLKFMITLCIKLYKEKLDGTVDYAEPRFHPRNQLALFELNEIEYRLTETFAQIQEAIEKWVLGAMDRDRDSTFVVMQLHSNWFSGRASLVLIHPLNLSRAGSKRCSQLPGRSKVNF